VHRVAASGTARSVRDLFATPLVRTGGTPVVVVQRGDAASTNAPGHAVIEVAGTGFVDIATVRASAVRLQLLDGRSRQLAFSPLRPAVRGAAFVRANRTDRGPRRCPAVNVGLWIAPVVLAGLAVFFWFATWLECVVAPPAFEAGLPMPGVVDKGLSDTSVQGSTTVVQQGALTGRSTNRTTSARTRSHMTRSTASRPGNSTTSARFHFDYLGSCFSPVPERGTHP
jgi:hypothetical protein